MNKYLNDVWEDVVADTSTNDVSLEMEQYAIDAAFTDFKRTDDFIGKITDIFDSMVNDTDLTMSSFESYQRSTQDVFDQFGIDVSVDVVLGVSFEADAVSDKKENIVVRSLKTMYEQLKRFLNWIANFFKKTDVKDKATESEIDKMENDVKRINGKTVADVMEDDSIHPKVKKVIHDEVTEMKKGLSDEERAKIAIKKPVKEEGDLEDAKRMVTVTMNTEGKKVIQMPALKNLMEQDKLTAANIEKRKRQIQSVYKQFMSLRKSKQKATFDVEEALGAVLDDTVSLKATVMTPDSTLIALKSLSTQCGQIITEMTGFVSKIESTIDYKIGEEPIPKENLDKLNGARAQMKNAMYIAQFSQRIKKYHSNVLGMIVLITPHTVTVK